MLLRRFFTFISVAVLALSLVEPALAREPAFTRQEDVIYGRKFGTALTMDIFTPKSGANGAAVVFVVSGGFMSSHENINPIVAKPFLARLHGLRGRARQPAALSDPRDHPGYESGRPFHPLPRQGL